MYKVNFYNFDFYVSYERLTVYLGPLKNIV